MRLLICGDRNWTDVEMIREQILCYKPSVIINGMAPGADIIAHNLAIELGIPPADYPAEWEKYRKLGNPRAAGPVRNRQMLKEGKPERVLAFHDDLTSKSKGTKDMVTIAIKAGITTLNIKHGKNNETLILTGSFTKEGTLQFTTGD